MTFEKENKQFGQYIFDNHYFEGTPDKFLELTAPLIGYLIHTFNSLDEALNSAICMRINDRTDEPGAIIIHKMSFSSKVDLFNNLNISIQNASGKTMPSFKKLITNLKMSAKLRNAVVHAEWENMSEKGFTYVKMSCDKNGVRQHYWQFTPESLESAIDFIHQTYMMFDPYEIERIKLLSH